MIENLDQYVHPDFSCNSEKFKIIKCNLLTPSETNFAQLRNRVVKIENNNAPWPGEWSFFDRNLKFLDYDYRKTRIQSHIDNNEHPDLIDLKLILVKVCCAVSKV